MLKKYAEDNGFRNIVSVPFGIVRRKLPTDNLIGSVTEMLFLSVDAGIIFNGCS